MTLNTRAGAILRQMRQSAGMTLADVGNALPDMGLSRAQLSLLERGRQEWGLHRIEALCALYGAEPREVLQ